MNDQTKPKFRSVSLNANLVGDIEKYVAENKRYASVTDFIREAARLRLEQLEQLEKI